MFYEVRVNEMNELQEQGDNFNVICYCGDNADGLAFYLIEVPDRPGVGLRDGLPDIDWVEIPAGPFLMGSSDADIKACNDEKPQHEVTLPDYWISRYPITYRQFQAFIEDGGYEDERWWRGLGERQTEPGDQRWKFANHPRENVSWYEAVAFCRWLSAKTGQEVRLPTEAEWEKAARGPDGLIYPYGNEFDAEKGNVDETGIGSTSAVGIFPDGVSPYGVLDMSGNVWEWCMTKWRPDYSTNEDNSPEGTDSRVLRGGSWLDSERSARAAYRDGAYTGFRNYDLGFRVLVCSSPMSNESLGLALEKAERRAREAEAALAEMTEARDAVQLTLRTTRRVLNEADDRIADLKAKCDELCRDLSAADDRITELEDAGRENEEWRRLGERAKDYLVGMRVSRAGAGKEIHDAICDLLEFGTPAETE